MAGPCGTPDDIKSSECVSKIYHYGKIQLLAAILLLSCAAMMYSSASELNKLDCSYDSTDQEAAAARAAFFNGLGNLFVACFVFSLICAVLAHCGAAKKSKGLITCWVILMSLISGGVIMCAAWPALMGAFLNIYCQDMWGYQGTDEPTLPGQACCQCGLVMEVNTTTTDNCCTASGGTAAADICFDMEDGTTMCFKDCPNTEGNWCLDYEATIQDYIDNNEEFTKSGTIQCVSPWGSCTCACKEYNDYLCRVAVPGMTTGTILMVITFLLSIIGTCFGYCICCCGKDKEIFDPTAAAAAPPVVEGQKI